MKRTFVVGVTGASGVIYAKRLLDVLCEKENVHLIITKIARDIHRKMTSQQDLNAKPILTKLGMQVTELNSNQVEAFRKLAQPPVKAYVEKEVGKELVAEFFQTIAVQRKAK